MVDNRSNYVQSGTYTNQIANRTENAEHEHEHFTESSQSLNVNIVNDKERKTEDDTKVLHTSHKEHSTVLLKTAVATVWSDRIGIDASILFDEGAQRSFITEDLAMKLKLKVDNTETIQLSCFGDTGNTIQHLGKVTLLVETETNQKISIDELVIPKIAVPFKNQIRKLDFTENKYMYLQGLNLAHPITDESIVEIDVLIGADYYWQFVGDKIIRGDGPTAVNSNLGYLLSGPLKETSIVKAYDNTIKKKEHKSFVGKIDNEGCNRKIKQYIPHHRVRKKKMRVNKVPYKTIDRSRLHARLKIGEDASTIKSR